LRRDGCESGTDASAVENFFEITKKLFLSVRHYHTTTDGHRWRTSNHSFGVEHSAPPPRALDGSPVAAEAAWLEREEARTT
jgi:hypothetical protein